MSKAADSVQAATAVPLVEIKPACEAEMLILNLKNYTEGLKWIFTLNVEVKKQAILGFGVIDVAMVTLPSSVCSSVQ